MKSLITKPNSATVGGRAWGEICRVFSPLPRRGRGENTKSNGKNYADTFFMIRTSFSPYAGSVAYPARCSPWAASSAFEALTTPA